MGESNALDIGATPPGGGGDTLQEMLDQYLFEHRAELGFTSEAGAAKLKAVLEILTKQTGLKFKGIISPASI